MTQEQLNQLVTIIISVCGALGSLLVVFFKTRTATLEKKLKQPISLKNKCILFTAPNGEKYLIDLDEEDILTKSDISFSVIKEFIDLDKEKKEK